MKRLLLTGLLLPVCATAQEVKPILSADYLALVRNDSFNLRQYRPVDSTNSISKSPFHLGSYGISGGFTAKKISIEKNNLVTLQPTLIKDLYIAGSLSSTIVLQQAGKTPALQHEYAQGRSANGELVWRGPETAELFSYGPSLNTLEFDGNNYPYDVNGRLVVAGNGNGRRAIAYSPSIFRTATLFSNTATLQTKYRNGYQQQFNTVIKADHSRGNSFMIANKNKSGNFFTSVEKIARGFTVCGNYNYRFEYFSNSNRNGLLNRVYRTALLSPASFDNSQGYKTGSLQRSYSPLADNPFFLLSNDRYLFHQLQNTANLFLEQKFSKVKIKLSQSYESLQQQSDEGYQPGTAFFHDGIAIKRGSRYRNYFLDANAQYIIPLDNDQFTAQLTGNYIYTNKQSAIDYSPDNLFYRYRRSSHDAALGFSSSYRQYHFEAGLNLLNKIYATSTAASNSFFLPTISGFARVNELFGMDNLSAKLTGAYSRFSSELPIDKSFAQTGLVKYRVADAMQYLPVNEVVGFANLQLIQHREYTAGLEIGYQNEIVLKADWFRHYTCHDIFPTVNDDKLQLQNMADHVKNGIELELLVYPWPVNYRTISFSGTLSFVAYRSKITDIKNGYDFTPIAGFSDVHKAIVKGKPLGVIVGNTYLKDINNKTIIGQDGFPLVNNILSVIGDPNPDFIVKQSNRLGFKKWELNIDWEWRKGGDTWNGTAASLDYYGRSARTAALRNTANYIFDGVNENGTRNSIPVNFYDPSLPVYKNRWTRYGESGVAAAYIEKADCIRLNDINLSFRPTFKKHLREIVFTISVNNIMLWSAYKGADAGQLLNDQAGSSGLDFFNLPAYRSFGFSTSLQF